MDTGNQTFLDLYLQHRFDIPELATQTGETQSTLRNMLNYQPVARHIAKKILTQLATTLKKELTLETFDIPLLPTFAQIFKQHDAISIPELAKKAKVLPDIINRMLEERPVLPELATNVLGTLSEMTEQSYTLQNVEINIYVIVANQSEVAELMRNIEAQYSSAQMALNGPTQGTAQHEYMIKRLENIAGYANELYTLVGMETGNQLLQQFGD